jgi:hypothetical protein
MTDLVAERFAALAETTDDSDWLDVRRRARRRRARFVVPVALVAAAAIAAGAVAASGGWLFTGHDKAVLATTHVTVGGQSWQVTLTSNHGARVSYVCIGAMSGSKPAGGGTCDMVATHAPFTAARVDVPGGGQIWAGTTLGRMTRITVVDAAGRSHSAVPVEAPKGTKTPFRYWAVAVPRTIGMTLVAQFANGRSIRWNLR